MQTHNVHSPLKRKAIDDVIEACELAKRYCSMTSMHQEFNLLLAKKKIFLERQKKASLLVDPFRIDEFGPMHEFSTFYRKLSNAPMPTEEHRAQLNLIEQVIQESIIIEWPRKMTGLYGEDGIVEYDVAPLIHRARNVVKCRTSHPTMRIKVFAISNEADSQYTQPKTVEAFFRASLIKLTHDGSEKHTAGRMILTQREGTPATKCIDQNGATVNSEGKLIASQAASDTHTYLLLDQMNEKEAKTTHLKYENNVLCATFPEMGVTLNSMVDRRQLATRYAVQIEISINIDNKLIINHIVNSHPFLIAITNDQTEPLMHSVFWQRLLNTDQQEPVEGFYTEAIGIPWSIIRQTLCHYVKAQVPQVRSLQHHELCHLQCMIMLQRILKCSDDSELILLEAKLFGDNRPNSEKDIAKHIRDRLLEEEILPTVLIDKRELMSEKCISILDMSTELNHSVWQWLFRASEMIVDVGHKLAPSPIMCDKKMNKTKRQMAASEEYQTMTGLFNKGYLTFCSTHMIKKAFEELDTSESDDTMMIRFCEENLGYLSFVYGCDQSKLPLIGSLSSDRIRDFKQGLTEVLLDEHYPARFEKILRIEQRNESSLGVSATRKILVFPNYRTTRIPDESVQVLDEETIRINPLTGEKVRRVPPPPQTSKQEKTEATQQSSTTNKIQDYPISFPSGLMSLFNEQCNSHHLLESQIKSSYDIRSLLMNDRSVMDPSTDPILFRTLLQQFQLASTEKSIMK